MRHVHGFSRRLFRALKQTEAPFSVNGVVCRFNCRLSTGDVLEISFPVERRSPRIKSEHIPLDIVYEDNDVMVINKQAKMAVMPSLNDPEGTLTNALSGYYDEINLHSAIHIVTRLDKDTSGLVLVAKNRFAHMALSFQQKSALITRRYYAIVEGEPEEEAGVFCAPIGRKDGSIIERTVRPDGKYARTFYNLLYADKSHALVDVRLETGRTHQIRVHFAHAGFSLAGDTLYGGHTGKIHRHALHCYHLEFIHPVTQEKHNYDAPLPEDMRTVFGKKIIL
nr:RluA family pseudouridine synthase [Lentibacillus sp. JNUCC-1]